MKYTMVIADDEFLVLKSLELLLRKEFPDIEIIGTAENGIELKQMLEQRKPDMAIVDVRMPGLTGIEVIELMQHKECRTHFVIHTAYSDFDYVKKALDLKTDGYLLKPGKQEESIETIRRLCRTVEEEKKRSKDQERLNTAVEKVNSVLGSEVLLSIFSEECNEEGFKAFCDIYSVPFSYGCIATFLPMGPVEIDTKDLHEVLTEALGGLCGFLTTITSKGVVVMFCIPKELQADRRKSWCVELAQLVSRCLKDNTGKEYRFGVGEVYDSFSAMRDSYRDSISDFRLSGTREELEDGGRDKAHYIARAKQYVMDYFRTDISLQNCAEWVGISPYYLSHIFKEYTGQTFVEYLSMVRIEEAKLLTENKGLTIKDIAEQCGYMNITYFCKVFKRLTGMTIGEYRKQETAE